MEGTSSPKVPTWALALVVPVLAVIVAVVTLNVTSDDAGGSAGGSTTPAKANAVVIKDFAFSPTPLRVTAGTSVTVTNEDGTAHTLTADNGKFDTGNLAGGKKMTITIDKPGTYAYHCDIHNYMTGVIEAS